MIETLLNLKNNKAKKVAAAQSQGGDSMERMKKFLSGLTKSRTGKPRHMFANHVSDMQCSTLTRTSKGVAERPPFG